MWFKNVKIFTLSKSLSFSDDDLQRMLAEVAFRPCGSQEQATMGWVSPLGQPEQFFHAANGSYWLTLKKQERLLPASVVNAELEEKVAQIEQDTGAPVNKKAKQDLKQEIMQRMLPQAFTKNSHTQGVLIPEKSLVLVDASSDGKAEAFLAFLRKALGSLPALPLARQSQSATLTQWVKEGKAHDGFTLTEEAEFQSDQEDGGIVRVKQQDLGADEIIAHLDNGKRVTKLGLQWQEALTAIVDEDLSVKRIKFSDVFKEQNEDIPKDEKLARMDADFALCVGEMLALCEGLSQAFALDAE